ncbi:MAG: hypothetical protein E2O95_00600 [Acidobacteria bacterium]|nr:MAG: hypothetical protein E2O95_00600 [Acidobacteriota bacterium]
MASITGWKIFYDDESVYSSRMGSWRDAPGDGVIRVLLYEDKTDGQGRPTRSIHHGQDLYFSDGNQLFGSNNDTLQDNLGRYPRLTSEDFKRGRWTSGEISERIRRVVIDDYERP